MYCNTEVIAVIPAKQSSSRLPDKNRQKINGKTLTELAYNYAQASSYVDKIIISTDAADLSSFGDVSNAIHHSRKPEHLGEAPLKDVLLDVIQGLGSVSPDPIIVCVQPDHIGREMSFDASVEKLITVGDVLLKSKEIDGTPSGAYYMGMLSTFELLNPQIQYVMDAAINIHYLEDLERARELLNE